MLRDRAADDGIGVAAEIKALREELQAAIEAGRDEPLRFRLSPIELTLEVAVTKDANGKVGTGYLIPGRRVLTAWHCTVDELTRSTPLSLRVVRLSDGADSVTATSGYSNDVSLHWTWKAAGVMCGTNAYPSNADIVYTSP